MEVVAKPVLSQSMEGSLQRVGVQAAPFDTLRYSGCYRSNRLNTFAGVY